MTQAQQIVALQKRLAEVESYNAQLRAALEPIRYWFENADNGKSRSSRITRRQWEKIEQAMNLIKE
jgi:hypothetical protein